jgi:1-acyl-sn-glycerol-3-phosphate acyltransferase
VLRTLIALPLAAVLTLACGALGLGAGVWDRSGRLPHRVGRLWGSWLLALLGIRTSVAGLEHLPAGPAVYAANHASALDIPIAFGTLPVDFRFIHKRSLHLLPLIGWYLLVAGHVAIDRGKPFRAHKSLEVAARRIRGGTSVVVFPEGTRSRDERVRRFKRGSIVLALEAGVPLVPMSLDGVKRVIPRGILSLRPGEVRVRVHPHVATAGLASSDAGVVAEQVRRIVVSGLEG